MREQYGNSIEFRLLKWLNPLLMTAVFAVCWYVFYITDSAAALPAGDRILVVVGYMALLMWLDKTYHALTIGLLRVSELVYSQGLSICITNVVCYAVVSLYLHRFLPIGIVLAVMAAQFAIGVVWSLIANAIYHKAYPAPETVIIYRNRTDLERLRRIRYFSEHFDVQKEIEDPQLSSGELLSELRGFKVVFVVGIESTLRNDIAKYCVENEIRATSFPGLAT